MENYNKTEPSPADEPSPPMTREQAAGYARTDDRLPDESETDALLRHLMEDNAIQKDQQEGYRIWWTNEDGHHQALDGADAETDGMREILEDTLDRGRAISSQEKKPSG